MQRHRMVYAALAEELSQGLHALSMKTQTPAEARDSKAT
jgi:BolA-like protein 1